jgi:hypothetical protein
MIMGLLLQKIQEALSPDLCRTLTHLGIYILIVTSAASPHQHHETEQQVSSSTVMNQEDMILEEELQEDLLKLMRKNGLVQGLGPKEELLSPNV